MRRSKQNPNDMTASAHIKELKHRIFISILFFLIFFVISMQYSKDILSYILNIGPISSFIYIAPTEILCAYLKVAGVSALLSSLPIMLYELILFFAPIFETKWMKLKLCCFEGLFLLLFGTGMLFAIKILFPFLCSYLQDLSNGTGITPQITIGNYLSLFLLLFILLGCSFELPLLCGFFCRLGLINAYFLKKHRGVMIVGIFILSALITPPDVFSQCMVAIPLCILYEISILLCFFLQKRNKKKKKEITL